VLRHTLLSVVYHATPALGPGESIHAVLRKDAAGKVADSSPSVGQKRPMDEALSSHVRDL